MSRVFVDFSFWDFGLWFGGDIDVRNYKVDCVNSVGRRGGRGIDLAEGVFFVFFYFIVWF